MTSADKSNYSHKVVLDIKNSTLILQGRTCAYHGMGENNNDSFPIRYVQIIEAKPVNNRLTKMNVVGTSYNKVLDKNLPYVFPHRLGDFSIKVKLKKDVRLYFINSSLYIKEFDINKLLNQSTHWLII